MTATACAWYSILYIYLNSNFKINIFVLTEDREVIRTIRENYTSRKLTLEQVVQWQTLPEDEVAVVSCNKADRKLRASKRSLQGDDEQPDGHQIRKEKREKKDLKTDATKKKQELLKDQITAVYNSGQVSSRVIYLLIPPDSNQNDGHHH